MRILFFPRLSRAVAKKTTIDTVVTRGAIVEQRSCDIMSGNLNEERCSGHQQAARHKRARRILWGRLSTTVACGKAALCAWHRVGYLPIAHLAAEMSVCSGFGVTLWQLCRGVPDGAWLKVLSGGKSRPRPWCASEFLLRA